MKHQLLAVTISMLTVLGCAKPALAANASQNGARNAAPRDEGKFMLGLSLSYNLTEMNAPAITPLPGSEKNTAMGAKLFAGLRLSETLSVEGQYTNTGTYGKQEPTTPVDAKQRSRILGAALVAALPLTRELGVTGKVGLAHVSTHSDLTVGAATTTSNQSGIKPFLGVGLKYRIAPSLVLRGEYEMFTLPEKTRLHQVSVGLGYTF